MITIFSHVKLYQEYLKCVRLQLGNPRLAKHKTARVLRPFDPATYGLDGPCPLELPPGHFEAYVNISPDAQYCWMLRIDHGIEIEL